MKLKTLAGIAVLLLCGIMANAQSIERQVTATSGSSGTGANIAVDYTIGETIVLTATGGGNTLTQGFHQPASAPVGIKDLTAFNYNVYPNPFTDYVQVELTTEQTSTVKLQLTDLYGRVVYNREIGAVSAGNNLYNINTSALAAGTYILSVTAKANTDKLYNTTSKQVNLVR